MSAEHQMNNLKSKKSDIIDSFNKIAILFFMVVWFLCFYYLIL